MTTSLLINEPPLQVLPTLAKMIGLNEAMVLQQLHYCLIQKNFGVIRNGYKWIFNTYEAWKEDAFPFWSVATIQRIFTNLENGELVIAEQLDKHQHDMKKYYRINYDLLCTMEGINLLSSEASSSDDVNKGNTENTTKKNKRSLSKKQNAEVIADAKQTVDKHFELLSKGQAQAWAGRETFADNDLVLVDWYHGVTGQDCPKSKRADWMKALSVWRSNGLTVADLQAAYDIDINWRKVFVSPNQLTDKALALRAQKKAVPARPEHQKFQPKEEAYVPPPASYKDTAAKLLQTVGRLTNPDGELGTAGT